MSAAPEPWAQLWQLSLALHPPFENVLQIDRPETKPPPATSQPHSELLRYSVLIALGQNISNLSAKLQASHSDTAVYIKETHVQETSNANVLRMQFHP